MQFDPATFSNPAMLAALQAKLGTLIGQSSGYVESLPKVVRRRITALENIQDEHSEIERQFKEEVMALERKYLDKFRPLYAKRTTIVNGEYEPTDEECTREEPDCEDDCGHDHEKKEETEEEKAAKEATAKLHGYDETTKGIPEFWLTIFKNNDEIYEMISEEDEKALKSLRDIEISYLPENPGFKLDFHFDDNEFFTNKVLSKSYYLINSSEASIGEVLYDHAEGTTINWKEDKDLTITTETKRQRHKGTNQVRTVVRKIPTLSFFSFFNPPALPDMEDETNELTDEQLEKIEGKLEADYGIGEMIKEKIIPDAVGWFTGTAISYDDLEDDEDFYDEEGEEDDEEEDDDDEDDDDDDSDVDADFDPKTAAKPQDCKQQ